MALDLARGLSAQAAGATAARLSFREFLTSPRFCGLADLSPAMLAIVDASEGTAPQLDEVVCRSLFGCAVGGLPSQPTRTVVVEAGGRAGKTSRLLAPKAIHAAWTVALPNLRAGEVARAVIIAPDKDLAVQVLGYCRGYIAGSPELRAAVVDGAGRPAVPEEGDEDIGTSERIILRRPMDGALVEIAVKAASRGGTGARSRTLVFAGLDEAAFFYASDGYTVNDREIYRAAIQRVVPGGQVWITSTPWLAHEGVMAEFVDRDWGRHESALVAHAGTRALNPAWDPDGSIERAMRRDDPENAAREIDAVALSSGTALFYNRETVRKACELKAPERAPDATGAGGDFGFVSDASAVAVVGRWDPADTRVLLGSRPSPGTIHVDSGTIGSVASIYGGLAGEELRPEPGLPLRPSEVVATFAGVLEVAGAVEVMVDGHSREAVREHADRYGIGLAAAPISPLLPHLEFKKALDEGRVALAGLPAELRERVATQLSRVRKGRTPGGSVQVILPRGKGAGHCDLVAALVLAVWHARGALGAEDAVASGYGARRGGSPLGGRR